VCGEKPRNTSQDNSLPVSEEGEDEEEEEEEDEGEAGGEGGEGEEELNGLLLTSSR
jgi:hypothetical protein